MSTLDFEPFARIEELEARIEALQATLERCRTVLGNMALEGDGLLRRWAIHHEPLRSDARNLLPVIDAALDKDAGQ